MAENPLAPGPLQSPPTTTTAPADTRTPYQKALEQQKKGKGKAKKKPEVQGDSVRNPAPSREGLAPGKFYVDQTTGNIMQVANPGFFDAVVVRAEQAPATEQENVLRSLEDRLSEAKIAFEPFDPIRRPSAFDEPENVLFEGKQTSKRELRTLIDSLEKQIKTITSAINPLRDEARSLREEVAQDVAFEEANAPGKRMTPEQRAAKIKQAEELETRADSIEQTGNVKARPAAPTTTAPPTTTTTAPAAPTTTRPTPAPTTEQPEPVVTPTRPVRGMGATAAQMRAANLPSPRTKRTTTPTTTAGGGVSGTTGGVGGAGAAATGVTIGGVRQTKQQRLREDQLRQQYPGYAWVFDLGPEFADTKNLLTQMLIGPENGGITFERFQALWPQSSYFRDARVVAQKRKISQRYGDVQLSTGSLAKLINDSISFQYDDNDLDVAFYNEVFKRDPLTNTLVNEPSARAVLNGTAASTIRTYANSMFTSASDRDVEDVLTGKVSQETYQSRLRTVAKNVYRNWSDVLDDPTITMEDIVKPWKEMAAQVLEMDPSQIDMTKAQFAAAYNGTDASGNPTAMSLGDWYIKLRTDPTYGWKNTTGAKQEARDLAFKLASTFGKII